jgi:riboflavin-specific deaminase-like protein
MEILESWLKQARADEAQEGRPAVSLCYAQSLDGCLTFRRGQPAALSGPESSRLTHLLRSLHEAILVGVGTVLADDPRLTVRLVQGADPQPVILDSHLRTPPAANLLREHPRPAWIAARTDADPQRQAALEAAGARLLLVETEASGRVSLPALLSRLSEIGVNSLMVEGGAQVISSFIAQGLADLAVITIAPVFMGGLHVIETEARLQSPFPRLDPAGYERLGDDLVVWGKLR